MKQHAILLKKNIVNATHGTNDTKWIPEPYSHWIAIGRFDEIFIYSLKDSECFLSEMQQDKCRILKNNNHTAYYHPLYLVPNNGCHDEGNCTFWFVAISRIHISENRDIKSQIDTLSSKIKEEMSCSFSYKLYYATEFSDIVLDIRSNTISDLLQFSLKLRKYSEIGKVYTYFGINSRLLLTPTDYDNPKDCFPLLSIRFSGIDMESTIGQIDKVKSHLGETTQYIVTGVDDIMLVYHDLPTSKVLNLYNSWLNGNATDSITRVGIKVESYEDFNQIANTKLEKICQSMQPYRERLHTIIKDENSYDFGWLTAISEVANSLMHMSRSPVMDAAVYLIAPGIKTFLKNIYNIVKMSGSINKSLVSGIYDFIDSCVCFTEQLIRTEKQLSQQPEVRPAVYNIPLFVLEYIQVFLYEVSELLRKGDKAPLMHVFILVPRPCERIQATELFPAKPNVSGLIKLQIPDRLLYTPCAIMRMLCHEVSHYVGEKFRRREFRIECYVHAAAAILFKLFFEDQSRSMFELIKMHFKHELKETNNPTIREMGRLVRGSSYRLLKNPDSFCNLVSEYLKSDDARTIKMFDADELDYKLDLFDKACSTIEILFREVFADICMLSLLSSEISPHIEGILQELHDSPDNDNISQNAFAIRIFVCIEIFEKGFQYNGTFKNLWKNILCYINNIRDELSNQTDGKYGLIIPVGSIDPLLKYASICAKDISESLDVLAVDKVKSMLDVFSSKDMEYNCILNSVSEFRSTQFYNYVQ